VQMFAKIFSLSHQLTCRVSSSFLCQLLKAHQVSQYKISVKNNLPIWGASNGSIKRKIFRSISRQPFLYSNLILKST
jgi:hypothetical protein